MEDILDESEVDWLESLEEDLIFQEAIFDAKRAPLMAPRLTPTEPEPEVRSEELANILVSKVYSGPTIGDVESALSMTCSDDKHGSSRQSRGGLPEKGSSAYKMGNKYTLRIKTCLKGVAEDGYKWRKYGQKLIKNSPNPRSYYRCTNPRCSAKKQVERSTEDPETIIVTYEGLHLHYTYSHFLLSQKQENHKTSFNAVKKSKIQPELQARESEGNPQKQPLEQEKNSRAGESHQEAVLEDIRLQKASMGERSIQNGLLSDVQMPQGMLEDVVPLRVREPSYFSQETSPSRHYSLFLSPSSSQIDIGILSSTL